jgi:uncharacterized membrane protein YozB (DUF420 family)
MDIYTLIATANLVLQIAILILLFGSVWLKTKKRFRQHGITMLTAVVLHTIAIFAIMIRSFSAIISGDFPLAVSTITAVHGILGILAEVLGVWIVASWRLRTSLRYCAPKKNLMLLTLTLWLTALILGVLIYLHFYTPFLPLQ